MNRPVTVAICTFRRPSLADTVRSVDAQVRVRAARIIVIDNDDTPSARPLAEALAKEIRTPLTYLHAPGRNIAIARNAALDAVPATDLLAFLDDDETAAPDWLTELTHAFGPNVAAVFGPSIAVYPASAPQWMVRDHPHDQRPTVRRGRVISGHTANCLIDLSAPVLSGIRFDPHYGRRGGSDGVYFSAALARGAVFAFVEEARVFEPVATQRQSLTWLLARWRRHGEVIAASSARHRALLVASGGAKLCSWAAILVLSVWSPKRRMAALLRCAMHFGVMTEALGWRLGDWYGADVNA